MQKGVGATEYSKNVIHLYTNSWPPEVYNPILEAKYTMKTNNNNNKKATVIPPRIWVE